MANTRESGAGGSKNKTAANTNRSATGAKKTASSSGTRSTGTAKSTTGTKGTASQKQTMSAKNRSTASQTGSASAQKRAQTTNRSSNQKRKTEINWRLVGIIGGVLLVVILLILLFSSCGKRRDPNASTEQSLTADTEITDTEQESTEPETTRPDYPFDPIRTSVYVTRDGLIQSAEITSFDNTRYSEERYNEQELRTFIENAIAEYNEAKGDDAVRLESLTVENKTARLILTYANSNYFLDFQGGDFDVAYLSLLTAEAAASTYTMTDLVDTDGKPVSMIRALQEENIMVLVVSGHALVSVNGDIIYYSSPLILNDTNTVRCDTTDYAFIIFR